MHSLLAAAAAFALAWCAGYYADFISRDPYNVDKGPAWYSKLAAILLLTGPFLLLPTDVNVSQTIIYNAVLSLAVSALIVPAVFANRTGEGGTWLLNIAEKAVGAAVLAAFVSFLTTHISAVYWYSILVVLGAFSMWSRRLLLLLSVQNKDKDAEWNDARVHAMRRFIARATAAYWVLATSLGALIQHSYVGVDTWNTGAKQLWRPVLRALGWSNGDA